MRQCKIIRQFGNSAIKILLLFTVYCLLFTESKAQFVPFISGQFKHLATDTLYDLTGCGAPTFHPNSYKRVVTYFDSCNKAPYWHDPKSQTWVTASGTGVTYTLNKNNSDDSTILTGSDGTRYAAVDNSSYSNAPLTFDDSDFTEPLGPYDGTIARNVKINENKYALKTDITFTDSTNITYFVDTISNYPKCPDVSGNSYLVGTSPPTNYTCSGSHPNPFAGHANQIVTNVGGVYNFQTATEGQHLVVTNDKTSGEYKYTGGVWTEFPTVMHTDGDNIGAALKPGTKNNKPVYIQVNKKLMVKFATDSSISVYSLANRTGKPVHLATDGNGTFFIVPDSELRAVYPIVLNDTGAVTLAQTWVDSVIALIGSGGVAWGGITGTLSDQTDLQSALNAKQATLVSGTNIKTVNGSSLLGSGNLVITGGTSYDLAVTATSNGQTSFTFSGASAPAIYHVYRNGLKRTSGYSLTGTTLTLTDTDITIGETIELTY
jgi:hypothetical protein